MESVKKTALIITQTLSKRSGTGRLSYELVSRLHSMINLKILTEISMADTDFNAQPILEPRTTFLGFLRNCIRARRAASGVDIVHAFDAWPYGFYGYCAAVGTSRKLYINGVGTYSVAPFSRPLTRRMITAAYRRACEILCISTYTKRRIDAELQKLPTTIMHMGTTKLPVPTEYQIADLRRRLAVPEDAYPIVVTVGEIKERKGQYDTLQALVRLKKKYPHSLYILVGSDADTYVQDIRKYAEQHGQNICITSELKTDSDLSSVYSIADIFALNSNNHGTHFEGFGLVILEAAQFGVPAIGSNECGIEDAIQEGVSGMLVGQMDHEGISQGIVEILTEHASFKAGALAWYTRFSWEKTISVIMKAYERKS